MGEWGPGIYSGDFASDLRSAVGAASKLPLEPDQMVQLLCELEPDAAKAEEDEFYTVFWVVVADQLDKRGIRSSVATRKAQEIIETGADSRRMSELGMDSATLTKREAILAALLSRLRQEHPSGRRSKVLREPQPLLFKVGECWTYPTFASDPINPYFSAIRITKRFVNSDGWGAFVVTAVGRAFGYLSWYQVATAERVFDKCPVIEDLFEERFVGRYAGTCSSLHMKKLRLQLIGSVELRPDKVKTIFIDGQLGRYAERAISDISIANSMALRRNRTDQCN